MKRTLLILISSLAIGCGWWIKIITPTPPTPTPIPTPVPTPTPTPKPPEPTPEPTPTPTPEPPENKEPGSLCTLDIPMDKREIVISNRKNRGLKGPIEVTARICDRAFCDRVGFTGRQCCPSGFEGSVQVLECSRKILKSYCPRYRYRTEREEERCVDNLFMAEMSCDHFDHDDPQTSDKYEGTNPECLLDANPPQTGWWVQPHGKGFVRACTSDDVCSTEVEVDK